MTFCFDRFSLERQQIEHVCNNVRIASKILHLDLSMSKRWQMPLNAHVRLNSFSGSFWMDRRSLLWKNSLFFFPFRCPTMFSLCNYTTMSVVAYNWKKGWLLVAMGYEQGSAYILTCSCMAPPFTSFFPTLTKIYHHFPRCLEAGSSEWPTIKSTFSSGRK